MRRCIFLLLLLLSACRGPVPREAHVDYGVRASGERIMTGLQHEDTTIVLLANDSNDLPLYWVSIGVDSFIVECDDDVHMDSLRVLLARCMDDSCIAVQVVRFWYNDSIKR